MDKKIIKVATQLCSRFGAHPHITVPHEQKWFLCNSATEIGRLRVQTSNIKHTKVHNIWSELTVTGVSAKQSVEIVHRVLGEI